MKKNLASMTDGGDAFFADELILAAVDGKTKFSSADTQTGNYSQAWLSERILDNRTSLIIDPPDGRIPPRGAGRRRAGARSRPRHGAGAARPMPRRTSGSARAAFTPARRTCAPAIRATSRSRRGRV